MIDYSACNRYNSPVYLNSDSYSFKMASEFNRSSFQPPTYYAVSSNQFTDPSWGNPNNLSIQHCIIDFTVPNTIPGPIFMYYRLTNFYQNHRQYIKNFDAEQFNGKSVDKSTLNVNCVKMDSVLIQNNDYIIYPCGLIANSMFNDTTSNLVSLTDGVPEYKFERTGIAWPTDKKKYSPTSYAMDQIAPPPNWALRYPNGLYTEQYPPPDLSTLESFMVWMHVAALPDFRKIWGRNDNEALTAGRWRIMIDMNFDTIQYGGTKWLVLSSTSPLGGRNPYLGIAYMAIAGISVFVGLLLTLRHVIKPRKLGDESYLTWNQPGKSQYLSKQSAKVLQSQ
ncbi:CDC50/LEM3 family [Pilobolus umbonatus]|nr:CDC50/LEM3 family [Pilobolus umbonatus]